MEREELLREAANAHDDNAALLVLADRLQIEGTAAGELIACQIVPGKVTAKRIKELERAATATWLGPMAEVIEEVEFRRGVPSRVVVNRKATTLRVTDGLWSLVEAVDLDRCLLPDVARLMPRSVRVCRIEGAMPAVVRGMGTARPPGLTSIA